MKPEVINKAAKEMLENIPENDVILYTDGSATEGIYNGGSAALIRWSDGTEDIMLAPARSQTSSFKSELSHP